MRGGHVRRWSVLALQGALLHGDPLCLPVRVRDREFDDEDVEEHVTAVAFAGHVHFPADDVLAVDLRLVVAEPDLHRALRTALRGTAVTEDGTVKAVGSTECLFPVDVALHEVAGIGERVARGVREQRRVLRRLLDDGVVDRLEVVGRRGQRGVLCGVLGHRPVEDDLHVRRQRDRGIQLQRRARLRTRGGRRRRRGGRGRRAAGRGRRDRRGVTGAGTAAARRQRAGGNHRHRADRYRASPSHRPAPPIAVLPRAPTGHAEYTHSPTGPRIQANHGTDGRRAAREV
ncbi:hypothetical protein SBRY_10713 [Actinacidiphila bryophytorum]|uniref:Uncharacterized protein n=1 Tax=Actinacidiphila bryophytorum TaxID=1436133 RepID=A0A9W4GWB0_9ACTN|nr:hypothetical protein SBRY_10713 [Actinacidiphila bryophytorum]